MIHDIRFQANRNRIKNNKRKYIENSNKIENINRIKHKYNVGDCIIFWKPSLRCKLSDPHYHT
jgi:hypothetical protein